MGKPTPARADFVLASHGDLWDYRKLAIAPCKKGGNVEHNSICAHRISHGAVPCDLNCADPLVVRLAKRVAQLERDIIQACDERDKAVAAKKWMQEQDRKRSS
jgi:hypothetical protein